MTTVPACRRAPVAAKSARRRQSSGGFRLVSPFNCLEFYVRRAGAPRRLLMPAKHPPRHVTGDDPQDTAPSQPILQVVEGLIQFSPPDNPSLAEQKLVAEIVILDHRTHNQLVP